MSLCSKAFPLGAVTRESAASPQHVPAACTPEQGWPCLCARAAVPVPQPGPRRGGCSQGRALKGPRLQWDSTALISIFTQPSVQLCSQQTLRMKTRDSQPNPSWGSLSIPQTGLLLAPAHADGVNEVTQITHAQLASPLQL